MIKVLRCPGRVQVNPSATSDLKTRMALAPLSDSEYGCGRATFGPLLLLPLLKLFSDSLVPSLLVSTQQVY